MAAERRDRPLIPQENAHALLNPCSDSLDRIDLLDANRRFVVTHIRTDEYDHGPAGFENIAELLELFLEQETFILPGPIREPDNTHLVSGLCLALLL